MFSMFENTQIAPKTSLAAFFF